MSCCYTPKKSKKKASQPETTQSTYTGHNTNGVALKIVNAAVAQIAHQIAKKNPYLMQNQMM